MWGKLFALAVVVACLTCGGAVSSGTTCSPVAPCGGNVVGTWKVVSDCTTGKLGVAQQSGCVPTTTDAVSNSSGSVTYNPDGTYVAVQSGSTTATVAVEAACLSANGATKTCAQFASAFNASQPQPGITVSPAVCSATATGGCSCTFTVTQSNVQQSGTYSTVGNTLVETPAGGPTAGLGYCVAGGTRLALIGVSQGAGTTGSLTRQTVFMKE